MPEVRLIGPDGEQVGIKPLAEALRMARDLDLDLVEVAAQARPPVCRILDYGKFKYQNDVKAKEARKRQSHIVIKEMKMRPKIDKHDYATKSRHVEKFLREGSKVKATIMFRGREMAHSELGRRILDRLAVDMEGVAYVESAAIQDGRNMTMVLAPHKTGPKDEPVADSQSVAEAESFDVNTLDSTQGAPQDAPQDAPMPDNDTE